MSMTAQAKPILGFNGAYKFLSNFQTCVIDFEGLTYTSAEAAYQASKTLEMDVRKSVAELTSSSQAKAYGRSLLLRRDWEDVKIPIMRTILRKKFYDSILRAALLQTGDAYLEETNYWHDNFWGHCICAKHKDEPFGNWLGYLLMETRTECQS